MNLKRAKFYSDSFRIDISIVPCWWHGVVGNASRMRRSYSTPGPVST